MTETGEVYSAWSRDEKVRAKSSSGGVFPEMAKDVMRRGGLVAGARFRDDFFVEHILIGSGNDIGQLQQSKYTQSDVSGVLKQIHYSLKMGRMVLFTGTPCQCAAVKAYLGEPYSNLIVCDFICRGVGSNKSFREYLDRLKDEYGSDVCMIRVREKDDGWTNWGVRVVFDNGKEYFSHHKSDPFLAGFLNGSNLRECCYECRYKGVRRPVDITLGDFWGVQLDDASQVDRGVSVVIIHSAKGNELFDNIQGEISFEKRSISDVSPKNPMLTESAERYRGSPNDGDKDHIRRKR